MFERIIVRAHNAQDSEQPIDLGALVECMLFYNHTELTLNPGIIKQIARAWGPSSPIALADEGFLKFSYTKNYAGIKTDNTGTARERYSPVLFVVGREGRELGIEHFIPQALEEATNRRGWSRRQLPRYERHLRLIEISAKVAESAEQDFLDFGYMNTAAQRILKILVPSYPGIEFTRFEVQRVDDALRVLTTIDFVLANKLYSKHVGGETNTITPAYILAQLLGAYELLDAGASANCELSIDSIQSAVAEIKVNSILSKGQKNSTELSSFQELLFDEARSIREVANSGEKSFRDVLELLEESRKFRSWVASVPYETGLAKQYLRDCTKVAWGEGTKIKPLKWLLFTGGGLVLDSLGAGGLGTAAGVAVSALDSFLIDPILRGWRPSQFVEPSLRKFVNGSAKD